MAHSRHNPFQQLVSFDAGWVSRRLGGTGLPNAAGWLHCRCPVHQGGSASSLALKNVPSGLIAKCFAECDASEIHQAIEQIAAGGAVVGSGPLPPEQRLQVGQDVAEVVRANTGQAARIWHHSGPDERISVYLRSRCIDLTPQRDLRLHPALHHRSGSCSPAIVALIRDVEGKPLAVHRIWLTADCTAKAPFDPDKMTLGPMAGGAVRLTPIADTLLLGEGIESTMSAMKLTDLPGWSTLSAPGMKAVQLPTSVRHVVIAADHDPPGLIAAQALFERLEAEGRTVTAIRPDREGDDFNDVLREIVR